mmetsp:Transcript_28992/g.92726  ORF Transcript_28992/g.92726 Transcript_28992/m.92726 type:complete len:273 (+) Transcript_28992:364-1182(+)
MCLGRRRAATGWVRRRRRVARSSASRARSSSATPPGPPSTPPAPAPSGGRRCAAATARGRRGSSSTGMWTSTSATYVARGACTCTRTSPQSPTSPPTARPPSSSTLARAPPPRARRRGCTGLCLPAPSAGLASGSTLCLTGRCCTGRCLALARRCLQARASGSPSLSTCGSTTRRTQWRRCQRGSRGLLAARRSCRPPTPSRRAAARRWPRSGCLLRALRGARRSTSGSRSPLAATQRKTHCACGCRAGRPPPPPPPARPPCACSLAPARRR